MKKQITLFISLAVFIFHFQAFAQAPEIAQFNFALWSAVYPDWNKTDNITPDAGAIVFPGPAQTLSGAELPISISIEHQFDGLNYGGLTNGIYPADVMKRGYYVDVSEGIIKISGLAQDKKYTLTCFGSKNAYKNENFTTVYTDVTFGPLGASASLNAYKNTTNTVDLADLIPNSNGEMLISVRKDVNALSGYLNAIVVTIEDNISLPKPDLTIVSSMINPLALRAGEDVFIETTVQNIGEGDAPVTDLRYYLSDDNSLDGTDVLLGEFQIKEEVTGLSSGESTTVPSTIQIPAGTGLGDKYFIQIVDQNNILDESDESNNMDVQLISILEKPMTRYVSPTGSDLTGDGTRANPYANPQFAVDQSNPYDTVHLLAGEYFIENMIHLKSNLTFRGDAPDRTKLRHDFQPYEDFTYLYMDDVENVNINNLFFHLTAQIMDYEITIGIQVNGGQNISISRCAIFNGVWGIVFNNVEDYNVINCTFQVYIGGFGEDDIFGDIKESNCAGDRVIKNCILHKLTSENPSNEVQLSYNQGGGPYVDIYSGDLHLQPTSPCIDAGDPTSPLDPDGSRADIGALPFLPETIYVSTTGSDILGDGSQANPYGSTQFAIDMSFDYDTIHLMAGNHIVHEEIILKRGIYLRGEGADRTTIYRDFDFEQDLDFDILKLENIQNVTIEKLRLSTSVASEGNIHTAIGIYGSDEVIIRRCVIFNMFNGIYASNSNFELINNTLVGELSGISGSGVYVSQFSHVNLINNIISTFDNGVNLTSSSFTNISYNNVVSFYENNYVGIPDQTGLNGNISADPEYMNFYAGDGVLQATSPCIDAGDPTSPLDPDGTRADIGAIPYNQSGITPLVLSFEAVMVSCFGSNTGSIDLTVSGGLPPYNFLWSNGATSEDIVDLIAGNYTVTVTDQAAQESILAVEITEPEELLLTLSQTGGSCSGTALSLVISVYGGTPPYTYILDEDTPLDMTGNEITLPEAEGIHVVTLTDANLCEASETIEVSDVAAQVPEICVITVDEATGKLKLVWQAQDGIETHKVYRESTASEVFDLIATVGNGQTFYTDTEADPDIRSYRYRISAMDLCGGETELSAPHKSMHLTVSAGLNDEANLIWDVYEGFNYNSFHILRGPAPDDMTEWVATVPSNIFSYTDIDTDVLNSYYQIEVVSGNPCGVASSGRTSGENPTSRSNAASKTGAITALQDDLNRQIEIYPNPADGYLNIVLPEGYDHMVSLELRDITGRLVHQRTDISSNAYSLDVHTLNNGVYLLHMKLSGNLTMNRKIVVNR